LAKSIDEYIKELRRELAGSDPALIQDALYDAEEFLHSELAALDEEDREAALADVINRYGTPAEIAKAYKEAETQPYRPPARPEVPDETVPVRMRPTEARLGPFFGIIVDPRAYGSLFYMLLSLLTGILYFTWVVTGVSLSIGLIILIIGIPFILLFLATIRAMSLVEGWMIEALLGIRMPRRPRFGTGQGKWLERIKYWFSDYRTWTTLLYMLLMLPLGIIYFTVAVTLLSLSLALIVAPFVQLILREPVIHLFHYGYWLEIWMMPIVVALGAVLIFLTLHLARLIGKAHGNMAKALLVGSL